VENKKKYNTEVEENTTSKKLPKLSLRRSDPTEHRDTLTLR
jgi:hypothetical protein